MDAPFLKIACTSAKEMSVFTISTSLSPGALFSTQQAPKLGMGERDVDKPKLLVALFLLAVEVVGVPLIFC